MMLRETMEEFGDEVKLRGVLHWPTDNRLSAGVVVCYPFGEERKSAARVMARAARGMCAAGFHVLRFDYRGTGESDGSIESVRLDQWVEDIWRALGHLRLRTDVSEIGVIGVRFGAALACLLPCENVPLSFMVFWVPLWSGVSCIDECRRYLAATRLVVDEKLSSADDCSSGDSGDALVDMGGFVLSQALRADLEAVELPRDARACAETVMVVDFTRKEKVVRTHEQVCRKLMSSGQAGRVVSMQGRPFWVTASRFDPQPLVYCTVEALRECMMRH